MTSECTGRITISKSDLNRALSDLSRSVDQYLEIQALFNQHRHENSLGSKFKKRFRNFYKLRGTSEWQDDYFKCLHEARNEDVNFPDVLRAISKNRLEASFASKIVATINPNMPVIDRFVLKNVGLRLPYYYTDDRRGAIHRLYECLISTYEKYLISSDGMATVGAFYQRFPQGRKRVTPLKAVDFILWRLRK